MRGQPERETVKGRLMAYSPGAILHWFIGNPNSRLEIKIENSHITTTIGSLE